MANFSIELVGTLPSIKEVEPQNLPEILKSQKAWIGWRPGPYKPTGKFDKIPTDPVTGRNINPHSPENWLSFDQALAAHVSGKVAGIGYVLSQNRPIMLGGQKLFLTAIDLDGYVGRKSEAKEIWLTLGGPYVENSPSGNGMRMLCLSSEPFHLGNVGDGREMYAYNQFVTMTGHKGRGRLRDCTSGLRHIASSWGSAKSKKIAEPSGVAHHSSLPETADNIMRVQSMLDSVNSDTDYENWRNIIWSLASTGWHCARQLAHEWSKRCPGRYDEVVTDKLYDTYDTKKGITLGTLFYHARQNGWIGNLPDAATVGPANQHLDPVDQRSSGIVLYSSSELKQLPTVPYRVKGLFPARGVGAIYGPPGSAKSFLCLDLANAIASGADDWFGFKVKKSPVAYVALEGQGGLPKRFKALEHHNGQAAPDTLCVCYRGLNLLTGEGVGDLASAVKQRLGTGVVVFVDTLNQASPGGDENSSETMGSVIRNAQRLAEAVEGLVILVHHSGKDANRGLRGHSSLLAAMDTVIEVKSGAGGREWSIQKAKDDEAGYSRPFELVPYTVDHDEDGDPVTSCAVRPSIGFAVPRPPPPKSKHQKPALEEIRRLCDQPDTRLTYKDAIRRVAAVLTANKPADRAKEAVDALLRSGHLDKDERGLYPV